MTSAELDRCSIRQSQLRGLKTALTNQRLAASVQLLPITSLGPANRVD